VSEEVRYQSKPNSGKMCFTAAVKITLHENESRMTPRASSKLQGYTNARCYNACDRVDCNKLSPRDLVFFITLDAEPKGDENRVLGLMNHRNERKLAAVRQAVFFESASRDDNRHPCAILLSGLATCRWI
jgi:hypothetical protein